MVVIFIGMALTGGAKNFAGIVPTSIKSGILLGAGLASIINVCEGRRTTGQPCKMDTRLWYRKFSLSFTIAVILSFFMLWSPDRSGTVRKTRYSDG
jgi:hypothetical protein